MEDARIAVETGVDGLDVVIGTSHFLREFSHGKDMAFITKSAIEVINFIKSKGLEVRFSSEDSFRSDLVDLLSLYRTVDKVGVNRVGIADTVGCASPRQVYELVRTLRGVVCTCILRKTRKGAVLEKLTMQLATSKFTCTTIPVAPSQMPSAPSRLAPPTSMCPSSALASGTALL